MRLNRRLRRYWPEVLLALAVALPWLSLLALGAVWLWEGGRFWAWAIAAAALGLLTWPLSRLVRRRANAEVRLALGDIAEPSRGWNVIERDAWSDVMAIADETSPFSFIEINPIVTRMQETIEVVARRFHPEAHNASEQFSLPEVLLLTERLSRDLRREALRDIPGIRTLRFSHLLWVRWLEDRYGTTARKGWRIGFTLWRGIRAVLSPLQAAGRETSNIFDNKAVSVLSYRLRGYATRMLVLQVGRAAIDLYSGRLALSDEEVRAAQERDANVETEPSTPVRIILAGQVNAGKSSLLNALAKETRSAIGPLPTTTRAAEYVIERDGRPAVSIVDLPGVGEGIEPELLAQAQRADLILWVASATQPARGPDRQNLDAFRAWAGTQLVRRPPPVVLALTHIDELRPVNQWAPPYDNGMPGSANARAIRDAVDAVGLALALPMDAIVPVAMAPGGQLYNFDKLWARIAIDLEEAKLVQLDRLRLGQQALSLRELAGELGRAGRMIKKVIVTG